MPKRILNLDRAAQGDTVWYRCCWDQCEKHATDLHRTRYHSHARTYPCTHPLAKHVWYVFCSERHRQLFLHSHHAYGKLPPGYRATTG